MASSGWQGQKDVQTGKYPHMALNLNVWDVAHSGTTLTFKATVRAVVTSGNLYYNNVPISLTGGGTIYKNMNPVSTGGYVDFGTYDCTITGVPASTTSYEVTATLSAGSVASGSAKWALDIGSGGTPPTGGYITYNSCTHNSVNVTTGVADWGSDGGELQAIVVTGSTNGYADPVTSSNWTLAGRRVLRVPNIPTSTLSVTVDVSDSSTTLSLDSPLSIKGMLHYKVAYWNGNSAGLLSGLDETQRRLPPAPSQFSYGAPTGSSDLTYQVSFAGNAADNHTTYVRAQLNRTIRYKIGSGNWTYIDNATTAEVDFVTSFSVTVPAGQVATVEGWQTYFGMDSEVSRITLSNTNAQAYLYGSVNNATKKLGPVYASVNGRTKKLKKIYASAGGVTKKVYEDV